MSGAAFCSLAFLLDRLREAIECLKRALIGADPHETVIRTRLAGLYNDLGEYAEGASYHKYIVDMLVADSAYPHQHFRSGTIGLISSVTPFPQSVLVSRSASLCNPRRLLRYTHRATKIAP